MTGAISTERLFSLACFDGLKLIRQYGEDYPGHADISSLDLPASNHLEKWVEKDCPLEGEIFYQTCIKAILVKHQPIWSRTMRQGRRRFMQSLEQSERDVFAAAGLLQEPPTQDVVMWWDEVSGHARLFLDQHKMEQSRKAELLSIAHEKKRLQKLGIDKKPKWPGLDDNFAGYDVLSYEHGRHSVINKMIEVKSTTASPLRFYISRNEWRQAERVGGAYYFHIWDMNRVEPELHIRTVSDVSPHVPTNNGKGVWAVAEIPVGI